MIELVELELELGSLQAASTLVLMILSIRPLGKIGGFHEL
jgi:hypothetical protein